MGEIDFSILDMLDIKDIQIACKHADIEILLKPIKDRPDFYKKYVKQLGSNRPDKKSSVVKLYMPRIAFDLFQKEDATYKGVIVCLLENYKSKFEEALTEYIEPSISNKELKAYNAEQLVELYFKVVDVSSTDVPVDFYFMMLKLQGVTLDEDCSRAIENQIMQIEKHKKEITDAAAKAEKRVEQKYTQEIAQLSKEKREVERKYSELKKQNRELADELEKIKEQFSHKKEELTEKWRVEFDKENMSRQMEEDKEFKMLHEKRQHDLELTLADDEAQKRAELKDKIAKEEKQLQEQFEEKKIELDNAIEGLLSELQNNTDRKIQLESELKLLQEETEQLQEFMSRLKAYEKEYFDNFEQHIIQKKVDTILLSKLEVRGDTIATNIPRFGIDPEGKFPNRFEKLFREKGIDEAKQSVLYKQLLKFTQKGKDDNENLYINPQLVTLKYDDEQKWYKCPSCGRVFPYTLWNKCVWCCNGEPIQMTDNEFEGLSFWRKPILDAVEGKKDALMTRINTEEHTAQLSHKRSICLSCYVDAE